jgi:hypothetical protein
LRQADAIDFAAQLYVISPLHTAAHSCDIAGYAGTLFEDGTTSQGDNITAHLTRNINSAANSYCPPIEASVNCDISPKYNHITCMFGTRRYGVTGAYTDYRAARVCHSGTRKTEHKDNEQ